MRLSQSDAPWITSGLKPATGRLSHLDGRRMSKAVARARHEVLEPPALADQEPARMRAVAGDADCIRFWGLRADPLGGGQNGFGRIRFR